MVKDTTATLTPKFIFNLKKSEGQMPSNLSLLRLCVAVMALVDLVVAMVHHPVLIG